MRNQKCNAMQLIGRQSLGVVVIAFSPPTASILWVSNKNNALWQHGGQTTEHAHDLSTSGHFPAMCCSINQFQLML